MGLFSSIGRAVGGLVKRAAPIASLIPGGNVLRTAVTAGAGALAGRSAPRTIPTLPAIPSLGRPLATPQVPQRTPQPGVLGAVRRALPGGRSGYTYDPYDLNTPTDKMGRPVAVVPEIRERLSCPPGYVGVDLDGDGVKDACVLKGVARSMGLYHSRPKPLVSGYETRALRVAKAVKGRVATVARSAGLYVANKKPQHSGGGKKK